ncbi:MAG: hypothetical protein ACFFBF_16305, partial [Promethearchaeota archaeon]
MKNSFAVTNNNSLTVPLNFSIFEFSDKKGVINNARSIDIELPSSTWQITQIELNFTNIEYYKREINTVEDNATGKDLFLRKNNIEWLGVQIELNTTTIIYGAYININVTLPHPMDNINVQITGYNILTNAPNSIIYGEIDLNYTIGNGWYYQNFTSAIELPEGNYFLVMGGTIQASAIYQWNYNFINPKNPDLYISQNDGLGWTNGSQGSPFLYKLDQENLEKDVYPEKYNMTAEIDGRSFKVLNNTQSGSGYLKVSDIDFCPCEAILNIPIKTNKFLFDLNYVTNLKNQFLSNAIVIITEEEDNFWKIFPNIYRYNHNYFIKIQLPNRWYDLTVLKDGIDITNSEDIVINGNMLSILNDTINEGADWEITTKSPKIDFPDNFIELIGGTEFKLGEVLKFSVTAPIREGTFIFKLYNEFGAEMHNKTLAVTSDKTIYSYNISL